MNVMHEPENEVKPTSIEGGILTIAVFFLVLAVVGRFMPDSDASNILLFDAATWFLFIIFGIPFLIRNNTKKDLLAVAIAFPIFIVTIFGVMLSDEIARISCKLFGTNKVEVIKILGLGISGVIALYGFSVFNRRAAAQDKANELTEKGHVQDRLKTSVDHLANLQASARIASFYEFFYLARDEQDYAENILGILCAHLRHTSNKEKSEQELTEQQTLIDILFSPKAENIFNELDYGLQRACLSKIDFQKMHKPKGKVDFSDAILIGAVFNDIDLSGFNFRKAKLNNAQFWITKLQKANLFYADLSGADLIGTNLSGADLIGADLSGANLISAKLIGAKLIGAKLSGAKLLKANFSGADLSGADLKKATWLESAILSGAEYNDKTLFPDNFVVPQNMINRTNQPLLDGFLLEWYKPAQKADLNNS